MSKKIRIILIFSLLFIIWVISAFYITIHRNPNWFSETEPVSAEVSKQVKEIETTDKNEFTYALSWSKYGDNWVCVNIDGNVEIKLDKRFVEVTDFCNSGYAIVKDVNGIKYIIDRAGNVRLCEYSYVCENIITNNFGANMAVATKEVEVDGNKEIQYGIIDVNLNWGRAPSEKNEYLKEFTIGIDGGVLTNETRDKLYFYTLDKIVDNVDEFLFYNNETAMYRKGSEIYLIDKSGEHERLDMTDVAKNGEWTDGLIYIENTDG